MKWSARAASAALAFLCTCARLPEIASGECGNGVIEPPEDCDTFADGGAVCRPKGSVGECHLDCARQAGDNSTACPVGWGCDSNNLCRRPTGELDPVREFEVGSAAVLASGDFDGDGKGDVVSLEELDALGYTRIKFHYFDERAALVDTRVFPTAVIAPSIGELSGDRLNDVVFSDFRVGVLLGRADKSWVPETFSSYRIPGTQIRTLSVFNGNVQETGGFIVLAELDGVAGLYVPDGQDVGLPRLLGALDGPIDMLAGDPASGRIIRDELTSPCLQAAVAVLGATSFSLFDVCGRDMVAGLPFFLQEPREWRVALEPSAAIDKGPQIVDANADGNLDVLVGAAGRAYVAYGDGVTLATAIPYVLPVVSSPENPDPNIPMPLAAADLTGDGALDMVFNGGLFLSVPSPDPALFDYRPVPAPAPGYYDVAVIADLNRDGALDVAAASRERPGITFFNGTGTADMAAFSVPTNRPVQHLSVGDFDGDRINDLAFTQNDAAESSSSSVMIAFGAPAGPPLAPAPVARLDGIEQIHAYREGGLEHLLLTSTERVDEQTRGVLTLLIGATTRIPMASYELTNFANDSSTRGSAAYRTLAGHFTKPGQGDVLAFATRGAVDDTPELWLLPALTTSAGTPVHLAGGLNPALHPITSTDNQAVVAMATVTADVDGDGRDEALLAMPAEDADHCGLSILTVDPTEVVERALLRVDEPCSKVELLPVDLDGDGFVELALLTGRVDGTERRLSIFWNDGRGGFDSGRRTLVADAAVSAQAFTVLPATPVTGVSLVYASERGVERVYIDGTSRELGLPTLLAPVSGVTGMTSTDLDGDGAIDVVLAARGNLHVLRATLEAL